MYGCAPSGFVSDCPARLAVEILSDKWAVPVVWSLSQGPLRHGEIADVIHGVSRKVLTQTLRRLQSYGLVASETRPQAGYRLTELGSTLIEPIRVLTDWSAQHSEAVIDSQETAAVLPSTTAFRTRRSEQAS
ncbi:winged helix-turn-helix transcriptional regulator [Actinoplanes palleronii]|uniref:HxlR family transcriptional regulator n=1 Tax=Actinoplanes palleronii TaxID=113570 RepID=A0ABQ4BQY4_9ACTN|nr:helix-turn-helix domain-containing protein [Actinoplanes palleronii]GIE73047.1 HxlR family transcriptional regulator [Actinoplanes palleronii]